MTARRKALADAVCGVISSLVSMIAFYPVDVWKTSLQADVSKISLVQHDANVIHILSRVSELFRGLPHKIIHTMGSSFTYFFVYSLVQTKYTAYRRRCMSSSNTSSKNSGSINTSTSTKLLLTAFAAVINTCITLPLDTISSRKQAGTTPISTSNDSTIDESNRSLSYAEKNNDMDQYSKHRRQQLYIKSPEKYKFSFSTNLADEAFATKNHKRHQQKKLQSILSLWNGLFPATLLCTNPAIQYTMFDTLKNALLQHKLCRDTAARSSNHQSSSTSNKSNTNKLSMWEAFVFGLLSKFMATIITYPLIRCKVMLMVSSPDAFDVDDDAKRTNTTSLEEESRRHRCNNGHNGQANQKVDQQRQTNRTSSSASITNGSSTKYPKSLPLLLIHIFRRDGVRGIYKGCSLQLLHTVLKSALLLMVREKITSISYSAFRINDD